MIHNDLQSITTTNLKMIYNQLACGIRLGGGENHFQPVEYEITYNYNP